MKKIFSSGETRFIITTGMQFTIIFLSVVALVGYLVWLVLALNGAFLETQGFARGSLSHEVFFDYVLLNASFWIPYLMGIMFSIFFAGCLLAKILLKPFELIQDSCIRAMNGEKSGFYSNKFFEYRLLSHFSELFFQHCEEMVSKKKYIAKDVPKHFYHIRGPVIDSIYVTHFFVLVMLISVALIMILHISLSLMREGLTDYALMTIKEHSIQSTLFFQKQEVFFDSITVVCAILLTLTYGLFGVHLYRKVSGAVFAFFSTMRSFMKGSRNARVHLLGYNHVRPHGRTLNQYLKYVVRQTGKK